jgi:protocatechuate 3,4-dioxygenase beta subunit
MKKAAFACLALSLLVLGAPAQQKEKPAGEAGGKKKVHLEGFVFDPLGRPLRGVAVSALVAGASGSAGTGRTDAAGKYAFDIDASAPFDITYVHSKHLTVSVQYLADKKDQQISTVLYRNGDRVPASAVHANNLALERLAFFANILSRNKQRAFVASLESQEAFSMVRPTEIDYSGMDETTKQAASDLLHDQASRLGRTWSRLGIKLP